MFLYVLIFIYWFIFLKNKVEDEIWVGNCSSTPRNKSAFNSFMSAILSLGFFQDIWTSPQFQPIYRLSFVVVLSCIMFARHERIFSLLFFACTSGSVSLRIPNADFLLFFIAHVFAQRTTIISLEQKLKCLIQFQFLLICLNFLNYTFLNKVERQLW